MATRKRRGNARTLARYWERGKGAAKIRYGQRGAFKRCVRAVGKYMARPEGYCALRIKAVTGQWPGAGNRRRRRR